jgi:hypothetical protein
MLLHYLLKTTNGKVMKKWRWKGLPPLAWGHKGNLTVASVMECLEMFGGLNMGKYQ